MQVAAQASADLARFSSHTWQDTHSFVMLLIKNRRAQKYKLWNKTWKRVDGRKNSGSSSHKIYLVASFIIVLQPAGLTKHDERESVNGGFRPEHLLENKFQLNQREI